MTFTAMPPLGNWPHGHSEQYGSWEILFPAVHHFLVWYACASEGGLGEFYRQVIWYMRGMSEPLRTSTSPSGGLSIRGIRNSNKIETADTRGSWLLCQPLCPVTPPLHSPEVLARHTSTCRPWVLSQGDQQLARSASGCGSWGSLSSSCTFFSFLHLPRGGTLQIDGLSPKRWRRTPNPGFLKERISEASELSWCLFQNGRGRQRERERQAAAGLWSVTLP